MPAASAAAGSRLRRQQDFGTKIVQTSGDIVRGAKKKTRKDKSTWQYLSKRNLLSNRSSVESGSVAVSTPNTDTTTGTTAASSSDRQSHHPYVIRKLVEKSGFGFDGNKSGQRGGLSSSRADLSYVEWATASVGDGMPKRRSLGSWKEDGSIDDGSGRNGRGFSKTHSPSLHLSDSTLAQRRHRQPSAKRRRGLPATRPGRSSPRRIPALQVDQQHLLPRVTQPHGPEHQRRALEWGGARGDGVSRQSPGGAGCRGEVGAVGGGAAVHAEQGQVSTKGLRLGRLYSGLAGMGSWGVRQQRHVGVHEAINLETRSQIRVRVRV
ncbi:hypothetical protein THAOC_24087 [Thalassiosira oceanica]|uniref:Uncharacterized protein n=1 Tax=Thalassiosira oceanica TaxID=159749 RepID=K0S597_THAOC|nr:hypothetical protein THAOC_24087 [Thalassiosira oceanica]|eukprot:EJK56091.1 hypothetical protein THAOC_24087 [Thalassiosira oceanica]